MLNDLFRTYKKIIIAVVLILSSIIFWFFGCHRSERSNEEPNDWKQMDKDIQKYEFHTDHISGDITFGTRGHLSADRSQPVVINIMGRKSAFTGTVKITLPGEEGKGVAYQAALKCVKGFSNRVVFNVPRLGNVPFFSVELLDQYGAEELAKMIVGASGIRMNSDSSETMDKKKVYIGVLSDDADKLKWLDSTEIISGQSTLVFNLIELSEQDLWGEAGELASLSCILIDHYDTSILSSKQKNCLKEWVLLQGGSILAGTGAGGEETLSGLSEMMGIQTGKTEKKDLQFYSDGESAGYLSVSFNNLRPDPDIGWKTGSLSFPVSSYYRQYGRGKFVVLALSLTDNALKQWTERDKLARELVQSYISEISGPYTADEDATWYLKKILYSFLNSQTPNTFYYALFFIIYISALCFFSYYVLRRIRKREYIWGVVPIISIFFTICLAIRARGFGGTVLSSFSAVEVLDSGDSQNDVYLLYQNNEGESSNVDLVKDVIYVEPLDYSYMTGDEDVASLRRLKQDYTINNTHNGFDIAFEETVPGTSMILQLTKKQKDETEPNYYLSDMQADMVSFHGTVTNLTNWHFSRLLLIRGNQYVPLSNVDPGEKREILPENVLCWSGYDQDTAGLLSEGEQGGLSGLEDYIKYKYINGKEDFNNIILAGITDEKDIELLSGQKDLKNHRTICTQRVKLSSEKNICYVSDINKECLGSGKSGSALEQDILEENKTEAVYQFDRDKVIWAASRNKDSFEGTIYAYNYQTGKDEIILEKPGSIMNCKDLEPYLSEMNKMTLTYKMKKNQDYGPAPILTFALKDEK